MLDEFFTGHDRHKQFRRLAAQVKVGGEKQHPEFYETMAMIYKNERQNYLKWCEDGMYRQQRHLASLQEKELKALESKKTEESQC